MDVGASRHADIGVNLDTLRWAEALVKNTRMTLTVKLDRNWSSFQLANSAHPLSVTDSAIASSARMADEMCPGTRADIARGRACFQ